MADMPPLPPGATLSSGQASPPPLPPGAKLASHPDAPPLPAGAKLAGAKPPAAAAPPQQKTLLQKAGDIAMSPVRAAGDGVLDSIGGVRHIGVVVYERDAIPQIRGSPEWSCE